MHQGSETPTSELYLVFSRMDAPPEALKNKLPNGFDTSDRSVLVIQSTGYQQAVEGTPPDPVGGKAVVVLSDRQTIHPIIATWASASTVVKVVLHEKGEAVHVEAVKQLHTQFGGGRFMTRKEHHTIGARTADALARYCEQADGYAGKAFDTLMKELDAIKFRDVLLNSAIAVLQHFESFQKESKGAKDIVNSKGELKKHWEALKAWGLSPDNDDTFRFTLTAKIKELWK